MHYNLLVDPAPDHNPAQTQKKQRHILQITDVPTAQSEEPSPRGNQGITTTSSITQL